jgi:hypothetical protein
MKDIELQQVAQSQEVSAKNSLEGATFHKDLNKIIRPLIPLSSIDFIEINRQIKEIPLKSKKLIAFSTINPVKRS